MQRHKTEEMKPGGSGFGGRYFGYGIIEISNKGDSPITFFILIPLHFCFQDIYFYIHKIQISFPVAQILQSTFNGHIPLPDGPILHFHAYASHHPLYDRQSLQPSKIKLRKSSPFASFTVPSSGTAVRQFSLYKTRKYLILFSFLFFLKLF